MNKAGRLKKVGNPSVLSAVSDERMMKIVADHIKGLQKERTYIVSYGLDMVSFVSSMIRTNTKEKFIDLNVSFVDLQKFISEMIGKAPKLEYLKTRAEYKCIPELKYLESHDALDDCRCIELMISHIYPDKFLNWMENVENTSAHRSIQEVDNYIYNNYVNSKSDKKREDGKKYLGKLVRRS